jgi:MinD-like ATPase involved in chromosome partitioning or flagellar assembly
MSCVAFASVAGAPGVSTLCVGVAASWPDPQRRRIVLEADPDGGRLGAQLGIGTEPGMMALTVAARSGSLDASDVIANGAAVGEWWVVPAPPSAEHAHAALAQGTPALARAVAGEQEWLWLVDAGRLSTRSPAMPLAAAADVVVLVTDGSLAALQLLPTRVDALVGAGCPVAVVLSGDSDWPESEIGDFCGCDVLGRVPRVRMRRVGPRAMNSSEWRPWWTAVRGRRPPRRRCPGA